jgi:diaminohydroxyphosphoribosylaminopyrimidine deaminase/5-amino-6-(5-phosphoribosylamino)uracil reductase
MNGLRALQIQSVLVEGGAYLLQSFIDAGVWDEAIVITNESLIIGEGLPAPVLHNHEYVNQEMLHSDTLRYYKRKEQ